MDCKLAENLLQDYLDNELTEELREQVRRHVMRCRQCAWEIQSIAEMLQALRESVPAQVSPDFRDRLLTHLLRDHHAAVARRPFLEGPEALPRRQARPFVLELKSEEN
jgi:anti-sigma factor RsiW